VGVAPFVGECSGIDHGSCVAGECICAEPWVNGNDWFDTTNSACSTHYAARIGGLYLGIVTTFLCIIVSLAVLAQLRPLRITGRKFAKFRPKTPEVVILLIVIGALGTRTFRFTPLVEFLFLTKFGCCCMVVCSYIWFTPLALVRREIPPRLSWSNASLLDSLLFTKHSYCSASSIYFKGTNPHQTRSPSPV